MNSTPEEKNITSDSKCLKNITPNKIDKIEKIQSIVKSIISNFLIGILLIIFLVPLIFTISTSFRENLEIYSTPTKLIPENFTVSHYNHVIIKMSNSFFIYFSNSVIVTGVSMLMILFLGSFAAFGLARINFIGKKLIIFFVSFILSIPLIITVIPIFMMETVLKIKNTNLGLILPYIAVYMPVPLFIMYGTFSQIPIELEESAYIDGANRFQIYLHFLPLATSGFIAAGIISFIYIWGEFLFALILNTKQFAMTLPVGILNVSDEEQAWALGPMSAVIVLSIIIPITLYLIAKRHFIRGLTEGAIKG